MKKTIANSNKYFSTAVKRQKLIVDAVYSSSRVEGSKITKKELNEHYKLIQAQASK
jgi:hypothetical protein